MKKKNIAVLIGNLYSPYTDNLLFGLSKAALENDVNILEYMGSHSNCFPSTYSIFHDMKENISNLNKTYDYALLSGADAIIVAYETISLYMSPEVITELIQHFKDIPVIIIGKKIPGYICVTTDNYTGIQKCVEHLINEHHRHHICFISGPVSSNDACERLTAYQDTMNKNNIPVKDNFICYGDYSLNCAEDIGKMIDNNPGIDGIVAANDTMAIAAYKECEKRGLTPGLDVSITGFDNTDSSKSVSPSLTTVEQNIVKLGIASIHKAIDAIDHNNTENVTVPVKVLIRESCGGAHKHLREQYFAPFLSLEENIQYAVSLFEKNVMRKDFFIATDTAKSDVETIIRYVTDSYYSQDQNTYSIYSIKSSINNLCDMASQNVPFLTSEICYLISCILFTNNTLEKRIQLSQFITSIQEYMYSYEKSKTEKNLDILQSNLWNAPMIVRNLADRIKTEESVYTNFMHSLISMYITRAYIFLNREPIFSASRTNICPESLELVASLTDNQATYYPKNKRTLLKKDNSLVDIIQMTNNKPMAVYNIYTENYSHGILVCEIKPEYITSLYCASFQIGTALKLFNLTSEQFDLQKQLQTTIMAMNKLNSTPD